jgi:hypothetical protein
MAEFVRTGFCRFGPVTRTLERFVLALSRLCTSVLWLSGRGQPSSKYEARLWNILVVGRRFGNRLYSSSSKSDRICFLAVARRVAAAYRSSAPQHRAAETFASHTCSHHVREFRFPLLSSWRLPYMYACFYPFLCHSLSFFHHRLVIHFCNWRACGAASALEMWTQVHAVRSVAACDWT